MCAQDNKKENHCLQNAAGADIFPQWPLFLQSQETHKKRGIEVSLAFYGRTIKISVLADNAEKRRE